MRSGLLAGGLCAIGCFSLLGACGESSDDVTENVTKQRERLVEAPPANGGVITLAGTGVRGSSDGGGVPTQATFDDPAGIAVAPNGTIYVADWGNNSVRRIKPDGTLDTFIKGRRNLIQNPRAEEPRSGSGVPGWQVISGTWPATCNLPLCGSAYDGSYWFWGGQVATAELRQEIALPATEIANGGGRVKASFRVEMRSLSTESARTRVQFQNASGNDLETIDTGEYTDGPWRAFNYVRVLPLGVTKAVVTLSTRATSGTSADSYFDGLQLRLTNGNDPYSVDQQLTGVAAVALTPTGNLLVGAENLVEVNSNGTVVSSFDDPIQVSAISVASDGYQFIVDSAATDLYVRTPTGVTYRAYVQGYPNQEPLAVAATVRGTGHRLWLSYRGLPAVFVYDCAKSTTQSATVVCTDANGRIGMPYPGFTDDMDGYNDSETLGYPHTLAMGLFGDILIGDELNHAVRRSLLPLTQTAAGTGTRGFLDGPSNQAKFWSPSGLAAHPDGSIIVADRMNNRIRKILCAASNVCAGPPSGSCPTVNTDDGNACTTDTCRVLGVQRLPVQTSISCSDGNLCHGAGTCGIGTGVCNAGPNINPDDGNACTIDSCDPSTGPVHTPKTFTDTNLTDCIVPVCQQGVAVQVNAPEGAPCGASNSNRYCNHSAVCEQPAIVVNAPALDPRKAADFDQVTQSIYSGSSPAQTGITANKIEPGHAGWLIGQAKTAAGRPLPNVVVSIAGDSSYGSTRTRGDGRFDLIVNGGRSYIVRFEKAEHLPVDRQVYVGWEETSVVGDAILLTVDPSVTTVALGTNGTGSTSFQVATGSTSTDDDGARLGKLMLPKGTMATMGNQKLASMKLRLTEYTVGPNGPDRMPAPLPPTSGYTYAVEVSADEALAAGASSVKFTRMVAGQEQPATVYYYLDNFLNADVGSKVPSGYYDRDKRAWVPSANGLVIRVLKGAQSTPAGSPAEVDVTGDGVKDDVLAATSLIVLGFTTDELLALRNYDDGKALWRVPLDHMTPFDFNYGRGFPPGITGQSPLASVSGTSPTGCQTTFAGSIIGCEDQTLGESVNVAGTPFTLNYNSSRAPLYTSWRTLQLGIREIPQYTDGSWTQVGIAVTIAGKTVYANTFSAGPYRRVTFNWDGLDGFGRPIIGSAIATITSWTFGNWERLEYIDKFGAIAYGPSPTTTMRRRHQPFSFEERGTFVMPAFSPLIGQGNWSLGGWTLSEHHFYDPKGRMLYLGSGQTRQVDPGLYTVTRVVGSSGGTGFAPDNTSATAEGTGIPRNDAYYHASIATAANGDIYYTDDTHSVIRRVNAQGLVKTIAGVKDVSTNNCVGRGDGGDSVSLGRFARPQSLAFGANGELYVSDLGDTTIRRLTPNGPDTFVIDTVAGRPCAGGRTPIGVPALGAPLPSIEHIAVGPEGAIYFADRGGYAINKFAIGGEIVRVAGNGGLPPSGTKATQIDIGQPTALAVGRDGSVYYSTGSRLYKVLPDGTWMGISAPYTSTYRTPGEGVPLLQENVDVVVAMAIDAKDTLIFNSHFPTHIRSVDSSGLVRSISRDSGAAAAPSDGAAALADGPPRVDSLAQAPDGSTLAYTSSHRTVYRISTGQQSPSTGCGDANALHLIPSGDEGFCFDKAGRHLSTINWRTRQKLLTFGYDVFGRLTSVQDAFGQVTSVDSTSSDTAITITAPSKQVTSITLANYGSATKIADALGQTQMAPDLQGLLGGLTDRNQNSFAFGFTDGLLISDRSPLSATPQLLSRSTITDGYRVTHTTPLNRKTTVDLTRDASGQLISLKTLPDATTSRVLRKLSGESVATAPDLTQTTSMLAPDPVWGFREPTVASRVTTLPGGATLTVTEASCPPSTNGAVSTQFSGRARGTTALKCNSVAPADPLTALPPYNPPVHSTVKRQWSTSGETITRTSPVGRQVVETKDAQGRTTSVRVGNLTPRVVTYSQASGKTWQLQSDAHGSRLTSFAYRDVTEATPPPADAGFIRQVTDALGSVTTYKRDIFGRVNEEISAKGVVDQEGITLLGYDGNGNLNLVTPPGRAAHGLVYSPINTLQSYSPPATSDVPTPATAFTPTDDRAPSTEVRPDGATITRTYVNNTGQLDTVAVSASAMPAALIDNDYYLSTDVSPSLGQAPGKLKSIQGPYGTTKLTFEYDGFLNKKVIWNNVGANTENSGSVGWSFDALFRPSGITVTPMSGAALTRFVGYDADDLITCVSATAGATCNPLAATDLKLTRSAEHAQVTDLLIGNVSEHLEYSDSAPDPTVDDDVPQNRAFGELRSQTFKHATNVLGQIVYDAPTERRDDLGRIRFKTETFGATTTDIEYQYDERGRLEFVQAGATTETFGYDRNGNRTSYVPSTGPGLVGTYDAQDRLTVYGTTATGTAIGDVKFTYGANGELKKRDIRTTTTTLDTWNYTYDALGNLITVTKPGASVTTYTYLVDGRGRRVGKKEKVGTGSDTLKKRWLYRDQLTPIAELNPDGTLAALFIYGSRPNVPDLVVKGTKVYRLISDQLGSPRMAVNTADPTDVPYRVDYSAFGVPTWKGTGAAATPAFDWIPFGFAGGMFDKDTGLVRFGARDYDPVLGRWVSKDPIRFGGRQANLYAYIGNDPINMRDPRGTTVWVCRRVAHLPLAESLGLEHWWLMTNTTEGGMGACGGGVPGNRSDSPYVTDTCVNDHSGEHNGYDVQCEPIGDIDESCVNDALAMGNALGSWAPWNQCQSFVEDVLAGCTPPEMGYMGAEGARGY